MAEVSMPQLGETVTEGTITRWFKEVGETVAEDEVLFEVSTDKVDSEVPSPVAGVLTEILVPEGETVEVGHAIAVVSEGGDAEAATGGSDTADETESADEAETAEKAEASGGGDGGDGSPSGIPESTDHEAAGGGAETTTTPSSQSTDRGGASGSKASNGDGGGAASATGGASSPTTQAGAVGSGHVLSPLVRRLVSEHGLDPSTISGSGVGGRITRADVEREISSRGPTSAPTAPAPASTAPSETPPEMAPERARVETPPPFVRRAGQSETRVPLSNIRRRTGEHMVNSKATSAHTATAVEVDYEGVDRVRRAQRERFRNEEGFSLTYLPFICRAVVDALEDFPHLNASVGDGELIVHHEVNLGVAVDLDYEGLLAPVVRNAEQKRLRAIAREVRDLAHRARTKQLSADDITGGTFTLTNAGSFGTLFQIPVISQPQVAILSTDGVTRKPVVVTGPGGSEAIAIHSVGVLAMSWDHRAFDGAYAAAFLARIREIIETRDWESEL